MEAILNAGLRPSLNAVYTFNDTIYNPSGDEIPDYIIAHEKVHIKQQGGTEEGATAWWNRFIDDPYFRMEQEIEAYARQYDFLCLKNRNRNLRFSHLLQLARILASETYGSVLTGDACLAALRRKIKTKR